MPRRRGNSWLLRVESLLSNIGRELKIPIAILIVTDESFRESYFTVLISDVQEELERPHFPVVDVALAAD